MSISDFEAVIGLEIHAQLKTETKIFCGCSTNFKAEPNTNICPVCLGYPGTLPVLNKKAAEFAVRMGIAVNCEINRVSEFARKNYFYPDLPKGYQISQFDKPVCHNGYIEVTDSDGNKKRIRINRIHLEEDAGKSVHDRGDFTLVDVNRCGVPLIEIVSEPDIRTASEAVSYLASIKQLVEYLDICDGNMEEGSLRCDANISVRKKGETKLGTKTEVKNMNSFKNVEKAINYEINRQIEIIEDGGTIVQETLLWNADLGEASSMRSKEDAHDYRYFPDPDLLPLVIDDAWFDEIRSSLPELPEAKRERYLRDFGLSEYDAGVLTSDKGMAAYFEETIIHTDAYKQVCNFVMVDLLKEINEKKITFNELLLTPEKLASLIRIIDEGLISVKIAREVLPHLLATGEEPAEYVKSKNLIQISDTGELAKIIDDLLAKNPGNVEEYIAGKDKVLGFFVGQVMRATSGKANPAMVNKLLSEKLNLLKEKKN